VSGGTLEISDAVKKSIIFSSGLFRLGAINITPTDHFSSVGAEKHSKGVETPIH
jgi:hypothetical protein